MKIVYCLQGLHRKGGIERVVTTKANYLADLGYEVHIVTTDQGSSTVAFPLSDRVQLHDLELNYYKDNGFGRWKRMLALYRKRGEHRQKLERLFAEIKPDVVVSTFFQDAEILPSLKDGSKKVLELHSAKNTPILMYPEEQRLLRAYGRMRVLLQERLAKRYDQFVILTEEERPLWSSLSNVSVIHNPRTFISEQRADVEVSRNVVAVGRYEYQKNFRGLINVWSLITPERRANWKLNIYGDGYMRKLISDEIERLGLSDSVVLHDSTSAIKEVYQSSAIYAMTSHFEGLPMVLLEAQAVGLPMVSYACPSGPRDIITHGKDGYLVDMYDDEAMAKHLTSLMSNDALREEMSREAYKSSERFALEGIMKQWVDLFDELTRK